VNVYKVLTLRTLEAVVRGEPSYWRLSDPLRWPGGIRGSLLAVLDPAYLQARISQVRHWCPLDSGGVRLGFQQGPDGVAPDELLLGADSLAQLLQLASDGPVDRAVRAGRPLWTARAEPLASAPVLEAFRGRPTEQREWTYEVFLGRSPPPTAAEVVRIYCPAPAAARIRELMNWDCDDRIGTYNPRWTLDRLAADGVIADTATGLASVAAAAPAGLAARSTPSSITVPWSGIRCVGGFEWSGADYWPSHVAPILVEVDADGRWRRWRYEVLSGTGVRLLGPVGDFTAPEAASFRAGGYLACTPQRFGPRSQLLAMHGPRLLVCERRRSAVRVLLREAVAHHRDRVVLLRCLRGIGNALTRG
jgi:hypothetical protein